MVARKKAGAKKGTTKKAVAKKAAPRAAKVIKEPFTRSAMLAHVADSTGLTKKQVSTVMEELKNVIEGHVKNGGARVFTLPGLLKIKVIRKPATKARKGVNPFTGQEMMFKAKPARNVVKVQPLKSRKDMAA
ncbi:MAG: HU family DNA-binding protein [Chromatiales bacterium]|jgi:nucleoid DNA-binding protein|nr:HU family DNA-binding protein [Chromatiales bacterium]